MMTEERWYCRESGKSHAMTPIQFIRRKRVALHLNIATLLMRRRRFAATGN